LLVCHENYLKNSGLRSTMKFAQHIIDKVNGKTRALKDRSEKIKGLNASLSQQYQDSLSEIETQLQQAVVALNINGLKQALADIQQSKSKVKHITAAILQCLDADPCLLESILNNPEDHFSYFVMLNYEPLHLLTALYLHNGLGFTETLLKLLADPNVDYRYEAYGVIPAVEILEMEPVLRNAMLDRILRDIVAAIQSSNFDRAVQLIDLEPEYFCTTVVPGSSGRTILFFAAENLVDCDFYEKQKLDFFSRLVNTYGCDINALNAEGIACKDLLIQQIDAYIDIGARQGFDGIYLPVVVSSFNRETYLSSFATVKLNELLRELRVLSLIPEHNLSASDLHLLGLSNLRTGANGIEYCCNGVNVSEHLAVFLVTYVFPKIKSIALTNCRLNSEVLDVVWDGIQNNVNIIQVHLAINNANVVKLKQTIDSRHLASLYLTALDSELDVTVVLIDLLQAGCKNLAECEIQLDTRPNYDAGSHLAIIKHNHNIARNGFSLNISVNFDVGFYQGLLSILHGSDKLHRVILTGIMLNVEAATIILDIITSCGNIKEVKIQNCLLEEAAKPLIATIRALDRIPQRMVHGCEIDPIQIFEKLPAEIVAIKDPLQYMQKLQEYHQKRAENQAREYIAEMRAKMQMSVSLVLRNDFPALHSRAAYDHIYKDLLNNDDLKMINERIDTVLDASLFELSVSDTISELDKRIKLEIAQFQQNFFTAYQEELQKNGINHWHGAVSDLNIIARIFGCKICLHTDYFDDRSLTSKSRVLEFGSVVFNSEIHLVRQGNVYFGYSAQYHTLIPNVGDDLNLFRACVHAFIDQKCPHDSIIAVADKYVAELRYATAVCMESAADLCSTAHSAFIAEFMVAQNRAAAYQFAKNLPQHNFRFVADLVQYKRIADAIQKISDKVRMLKIEDEVDAVGQRIMQLLRNQKNSDSLLYNVRDMRSDNVNCIHVRDLDKAALEDYFESRKTLLMQRQEERQDIFQDKLSAASNELAKLEALREAMIEALQEQIGHLRCNAVADINENYRKTRKAFKKALIKAGIGVALTFVCLELFAAPLAQLLFSSSLISNATFAKIAAEAIISSLVSNLTAGGKLKRLPEEISKTFIINAAGSFVTSSLSKGYSLQNLPRSAAHSKLIVATQMTLESSVRAAFNKKNIADEALATGIAATLLGCAIGIDATDKSMKLVFDPSLTALKEIVRGSSSDTIAMEVALQVVQSLATLGTIKIIHALKPAPKVSSKPIHELTPKVYVAGDTVDDLTYKDADIIDAGSDIDPKNSKASKRNNDYFEFFNSANDRADIDASIATFMHDRASLYPTTRKTYVNFDEAAMYMVGRLYGVNKTLLNNCPSVGPLGIPYVRSILESFYPTYELPIAVNTPGKTDSKGFVKLWDSYVGHYRGHQQASLRYHRAGNPFLAGFTSGYADSGVILDASFVLGLGYSTYRYAPTVAAFSRTFVASHEFRSPLLFSFEHGKLYNGPPLDAVKFRNPVVRRPHSKSGRTYAPTIKHEPGTSYGLNIIPDAEIGQALLDTAYSHPGTKQVFNVYNGKLIKFQPDNTGGWHAYEVIPGYKLSILKQVPHDVLKNMCNDKLISKKQYKMFIKNKE
jgi:hypothetical protein